MSELERLIIECDSGEEVDSWHLLFKLLERRGLKGSLYEFVKKKYGNLDKKNKKDILTWDAEIAYGTLPEGVGRFQQSCYLWARGPSRGRLNGDIHFYKVSSITFYDTLMFCGGGMGRMYSGRDISKRVLNITVKDPCRLCLERIEEEYAGFSVARFLEVLRSKHKVQPGR